MDRYDIAVIGTGPAGISAAITAKIRNKSVLLLGSRKLSDKMTKAERIDNYPGLPGISGRELAERMTAHLDSLGISVTEGQVGAVYTYGDRFVLQIGEETAEATAVILAGGVVLGKPLPGEEEFLGRGVSYCATCDGRLYRGKTVAVIAQSAEAPEEADYLAEIVGQVLYFPGKTAGRPKDPTVTVLDEIPTNSPENVSSGTPTRWSPTAASTPSTASSSSRTPCRPEAWCPASKRTARTSASVPRWRPTFPVSSPAGTSPAGRTSTSRRPDRATSPP